MANLGRIVKISDTFFKVGSESIPHYFYHVDIEQSDCTCPGHFYRKVECKHLRMVRDFLNAEKGAEVKNV